ncbi:RNA-directed DNA polymerase, eukaryota, reverse transcriptase zinc-binding domain protein [Tanacetum coccineum]
MIRPSQPISLENIKTLGVFALLILLKWLGVFGKKLNQEEAMEMISDVTDVEIKNTLFDIGKLLGEVNATLISLVPKVSTPNKVSDYRPIACCNVIYKCISKIITERLKTSLHKLVNLNQSAFIQGRVIQDNILITKDLFKGYDRKSGPSRERKWYFPSGRGLRQGDPMSPCLFTLVMEVFTLLMAKNVQQNPCFMFHAGCKELKLTHLCFADDLLMVCNGDMDSVKIVKQSIMEFSEISCLIPNMDKSTIFFGNIKECVKERILETLPFVVGKLPVKYLGVPLITKRLTSKDCKKLIDKVKGRVDD